MLNHLRVIELASVLAGPSVGQFFAELGAEVIKIENLLTQGDVTRSWKASREKTDDRSAYFCSANWGKKSIAVDLRHPEGKKIVHDLAVGADVVIASYKPGDALKLGVDYGSLSAVNPKIIYGLITGYGPENPRVGYDAIIQAEAGFMFMNGEPGGQSLKMPVALMDVLAAHHLKEAILLALWQREVTGKGNFLEVSLIQAAVASLVNQATNWLVAGVSPQKQGSSHPNIAPYGDVFATSDGQSIILAIGTDRQFKDFCNIVGRPAMATEPMFATNVQRVTHREELLKRISEAIGLLTADDLLNQLAEANVPVGRIQSVPEVFKMSEARDLVLRHGDCGGVRSFAAKIGAGAITNSHFLPPPHFGADTEEILLKILKRSAESVSEMFEKGIVK